ncbi:hypothetical protein OAN307_c39320 [Octadecabacter antarcticus 307]|uniref:Uncharacterized protein n=1 Tax=Octadecabacter antarcticus 307 TaxID=391626 RepID=M9RAX0_9RHOB|nr:hypothetical protein OAN307_c39320 [Octadecabacter antarcticus 307]
MVLDTARGEPNHGIFSTVPTPFGPTLIEGQTNHWMPSFCAKPLRSWSNHAAHRRVRAFC